MKDIYHAGGPGQCCFCVAHAAAARHIVELLRTMHTIEGPATPSATQPLDLPLPQQQQQQQQQDSWVIGRMKAMQVYVLARPDAAQVDNAAQPTACSMSNSSNSQQDSSEWAFQGPRVVIAPQWSASVLRKLLGCDLLQQLLTALQTPDARDSWLDELDELRTAAAKDAATASMEARAARTAAGTAAATRPPAPQRGKGGRKTGAAAASMSNYRPTVDAHWLHGRPMFAGGLQVLQWSVYDAFLLRPWTNTEYVALGGAESFGFLDMPGLVQQLLNAAQQGYGSSRLQLPG